MSFAGDIINSFSVEKSDDSFTLTVEDHPLVLILEIPALPLSYGGVMLFAPFHLFAELLLLGDLLAFFLGRLLL